MPEMPQNDGGSVRASALIHFSSIILRNGPHTVIGGRDYGKYD